MRVIKNTKINSILLEDLEFGDAFKFEDHYYMYCCPVGEVKLQNEREACVVELSTGLVGSLSMTTPVVPIEATVTYLG